MDKLPIPFTEMPDHFDAKNFTELQNGMFKIAEILHRQGGGMVAWIFKPEGNLMLVRPVIVMNDLAKPRVVPQVQEFLDGQTPEKKP